MSLQTTQIVQKIASMPGGEREALIRDALQATQNLRWLPNLGRQSEGFFSLADILVYGGQAGGGKSDLILGLAMTQHQESLIIRRRYTDLTSLTKRAIEINGTRRGYRGSIPPSLNTQDGRSIEFGACANAGDEQHWQGRAHDLVCLEEAAQLLESQARFLMGWNRSVDKNQRCRIVLATNPPLTDEGQWLFEFIRPWVDDAYPEPAEPGELRWYATDEEGRDYPVDGPDIVTIDGRDLIPLSRTFIPAALSDNPYLSETNYQATLDSLPEPLRSAMRDGDFRAGRRDDPRQLIPTEWIFAAQARWTESPPAHAPMCAMGVDVAQGGMAETVIAPRFDAWFAEPIAVSGKQTPYGTDVAALVIKHRRNNAVIVIDMGGGYGGAALEHLRANLGNEAVKGFKGAEGSGARTKDRQLGFINKRAESYWKFREALDPDQEGGSPVALPYDNRLVADLVSPHFSVESRGIQIESKEDIVSRLGRSPDRGDAVVMAWSQGAINATHGQIWRNALKSQHRPQVNRGHLAQRRR